MISSRKATVIGLVVIACVFICVGLVSIAVDHFQEKSLNEDIADLQNNISLYEPRFVDAKVEFETSSILFASHWSAGLEEQLANSKENLEMSKEFLKEAISRQDSGDKEGSRKLIDKAAESFNAAVETVDLILGPPGLEGNGLYKVLAFKSENAAEYVRLAERSFSDAQVILDNKSSNSWNQSYGVTFSSARETLSQAEESLAQAKFYQGTYVDGFLDMPLAYDYAETAIRTCQTAVSQAETREQDARGALYKIDSADDSIDIAYAFVIMSDYQQSSALAYIALAESTLGSARDSFWQGQYTEAINLANESVSYSLLAQSTATRPTPTPIPPPDDDDDDGGIFGSGGIFSGGGDSGGSDWDWGSDSGSYSSDWGSDSGSYSSDWGSDSGSYNDW